MKEKTCLACAFSYMETGDEELICGHPDEGIMGTHVSSAAGEGGQCGPLRPRFEQHPLRNSDGSFKNRKSRRRLL